MAVKKPIEEFPLETYRTIVNRYIDSDIDAYFYGAPAKVMQQLPLVLSMPAVELIDVVNQLDNNIEAFLDRYKETNPFSLAVKYAFHQRSHPSLITPSTTMQAFEELCDAYTNMGDRGLYIFEDPNNPGLEKEILKNKHHPLYGKFAVVNLNQVASELELKR